MSDSMFDALFRFISLLVIAGLTVLLVWSGSASIWWLFITVLVIFGVLGLGVLFACLYATAERENHHHPRGGLMPTEPPRTPPAGGSGISKAN